MPAPTHLQLALQVSLPRGHGGGSGWGPARTSAIEPNSDQALKRWRTTLLGDREAKDIAEREASLAAHTDSYFLNPKAIVAHLGYRRATYAVFMRRPVISTPRLAVACLNEMAALRGVKFDIELNCAEGEMVGASGDVIMYVTGPLLHLVDLETVMLQKLGPLAASPPTMPPACAAICPRSPFWQWTHGIAPAARWPS